MAWQEVGWDWYYTITGTLVEGAERLSLILMLVVLARRVRYGRLASAAEFLLAFVAMHLLLTPRAGMMGISGLASRTGKCVALAVLVLSTGAFAIGRRRSPGVVQTLLLLVATFALRCLERDLDDAVMWLGLQSEIVLDAVYLMLSVPGLLLLTVPLAAAAIRDGPSRTWLEWCGLGITIAWLLLDQTHLLASAMLSTPVETFLEMLAMSWAIIFTAIVISVFLVRRFRPAWRRWVEPLNAN